MKEWARHAASDNSFDLLVIGAGPTGMACAIEAQRAGFTAVLVDKGCLCNSLFHYPANMTFFTTPELLEIGNMPFSSPNQKPNRNEALEYYRKVAEHYRLDVRQYENVERVDGSDGNFTVHTIDRFGRTLTHRARKLVVATGYYDLPNYLGIPGEDLSKVSTTTTSRTRSMTSTCSSSAARTPRPSPRSICGVTEHGHARPSRRRDAPPRQVLDPAGHQQPHQERRDQGLLQHQRHQHRRRRRDPRNSGGDPHLPNHFVFALTGYHPDFSFIEALGVTLDEQNRSLPSLRSRNTREQRSGNLSRRSRSSPASEPTKSSSRTGASTAN